MSLEPDNGFTDSDAPPGGENTPDDNGEGQGPGTQGPVVLGEGKFDTVNIGSTVTHRTSTSNSVNVCQGAALHQYNFNFFDNQGPRAIQGQHVETRLALPGQQPAQAHPAMPAALMDPNYIYWMQSRAQQAAQPRYPGFQGQYGPNTAMVPQYHPGQQMPGYYPLPHAAQYGNQQFQINQPQHYPQHGMHQLQNPPGFAQQGRQMPTQQAQGGMLPMTSTAGHAHSQNMETEGQARGRMPIQQPQGGGMLPMTSTAGQAGSQNMETEAELMPPPANVSGRHRRDGSASSSTGHGDASQSSECPETSEPRMVPGRDATGQQGRSSRLTDTIFVFPEQELAKDPAQVFAGKQKMLDSSRPLAVKIVKYTRKKEREVKNLLKLTPHVNVVSIVDAREIPGRIPRSLFIAMEQCQNMSLEEYYEKRKKDKMPFNVKQALEFARQVIEGINHIHKNNIIHRDMKPSSILFSLDGKNLKIIDFGVSKELEQGLTTMSISTGNIGTDGFRAPEIYMEDEMKRLADIFSLAIVLYHIWSYGRHPFGEDSTIWCYNIKSGTDPNLSHLLVPGKEKAKLLLLCMLKKGHRERLRIADVLRHEYIKQGVPETMQLDMDEVFRGRMQVNDQNLRNIDCIVYQRAGQPGLKLEGQSLKLSLTCVPSGGMMKKVRKNINRTIPDGHLAVTKTDSCKLLNKLKDGKMGWTNLFRSGERWGAILIFRPRDYEELFGVYVEKPEDLIGGMRHLLPTEETAPKQMDFPSESEEPSAAPSTSQQYSVSQAQEITVPETPKPEFLSEQQQEDINRVLTEQIPDTGDGDESYETIAASSSTRQQTEIGNPEFISWWIYQPPAEGSHS